MMKDIHTVATLESSQIILLTSAALVIVVEHCLDVLFYNDDKVLYLLGLVKYIMNNWYYKYTKL